MPVIEDAINVLATSIIKKEDEADHLSDLHKKAAAEVAQLREALDALKRPIAVATNGAAEKSKPTTNGRRSRRSAGGRTLDVMKALSDGEPHAIPEIAKTVGIKDNYLYRLMPRMAREGQVKRVKRGGKTYWKVAA